MICFNHLRICFQNSSPSMRRTMFRELMRNLQPIEKFRYSVKIEDKPKKPANCFLQFCNKFRTSVREKYPNADQQEIGNRLAVMWFVAAKEQKLKLMEKSRQEFSEYEGKITRFREQLTNVQKEEVLLMHRSKINKKRKRARNDNNKPRRPQSPFLLFVDFKIKRDQLSGPRKTFIQQLATEWKNLNQEAKDIFHREYKKLFNQYEIQMSKWEDNMVKIGRSDLLSEEKRINFSPNEKYIFKMQKYNTVRFPNLEENK